MKKKGYKRVLGLKKWNKIVSALVKGYKKSKTEYTIKDVRKEASEIYKSFKSVPLSKLSQKKVKKIQSTLGKVSKPLKDNTIRILATDIPKVEIDKVGGFRFFELEGITDFNNKFPEVPILIKTPNNEFKINGKIGAYGSSDLSKFVNEELREEYNEEYDILFESSVALIEKNNLPYLLIISEDMNKQENKAELKKLLKSKVSFPKREDKVVKEVEERIEKEEIKKEEQKKKKRKKGTTTKRKTLTKKEVDKVKPTKKVSTKKAERTTDEKERLGKLRIEEQKNIIEMVKLGVLSKKEAKTMILELDSKYGKGGKV